MGAAMPKRTRRVTIDVTEEEFSLLVRLSFLEDRTRGGMIRWLLKKAAAERGLSTPAPLKVVAKDD